MNADYLVISCSLNSSSNSRVLALALHEALIKETPADLIDARDLTLPFCDGGAAYGHPGVAPLTEKIKAARCVILAVPIYNYSISGFVKNLIELTGSDAWDNKIVGFLCAAGGHRSYMSIMPLANSLMLDFDCVIIPTFVYGSGFDFDGEKIKEADVQKRVVHLAKEAIRFTTALG